MTQEDPVPTRDRVINEAMRLFGEQGYTATTIAQIEAAAGLSPGSGSLYKHFKSKAAVLAEGIGRLIDDGAQLRALFEAQQDRAVHDRMVLRDRVALLAQAGLQRLEDERDFNRVLIRDLQKFPDLLERARVDEIHGNHQGLTSWLSRQTGADEEPARDWGAVAAVIMDALAHYWLLQDVFGGDHPSGVSERRYLDALVDLTTSLLERQPTAPDIN